MYLPMYVESRDVADAEALMAQFGKEAGLEAADGADFDHATGEKGGAGICEEGEGVSVSAEGAGGRLRA